MTCSSSNSGPHTQFTVPYHIKMSPLLVAAAVATALWSLARWVIIMGETRRHRTARQRLEVAISGPTAPRGSGDARAVTTCCVTGASGLVGSHTVNALARKGHYTVIRAVDLFGRAHTVECANGVRVEFVVADICDVDAMSAVLAGCSAVFHVAALVDTRRGKLIEARLMHANDFGTQVRPDPAYCCTNLPAASRAPFQDSRGVTVSVAFSAVC